MTRGGLRSQTTNRTPTGGRTWDQSWLPSHFRSCQLKSTCPSCWSVNHSEQEHQKKRRQLANQHWLRIITCCVMVSTHVKSMEVQILKRNNSESRMLPFSESVHKESYTKSLGGHVLSSSWQHRLRHCAWATKRMVGRTYASTRNIMVMIYFVQYER